MEFINPAVHPADLPRAEDIPLQPVSRKYLRVLRIEWAITTLALTLTAAGLILGISALRQTAGWIFITAGWTLLTGVYFLVQEKSFPWLAYAVREKDVLFRRGWIYRSLRICPFNRIQNCTVVSGPIERRHGLSSLIIYTAGSDGADMKIPGLQHEEADRLRHFILEKIHREQHEND